MIDESDKSLFRSAINRQMPIDKDGDKEEAYNNKKRWNKPFEDYGYLPKPNLSASDSVSHSQVGVSPKTLKKYIGETKELLSGQKEIMDTFKSMGPLVSQVKEMMSGFNNVVGVV